MRQSVLYKGIIEEKQGPLFSKVELSILQTLVYFDIFDYPLHKEEIARFSDSPITGDILDKCLDSLEEKGRIFQFHGFYSLQNNPLLVHRRTQGNEKAKELLIKANKAGRFLYRFPFVRGVGVSGSLSKNFAGEKADIDFFIITKANRLWLARTFMHLFKKLTFLTGTQHYYCMNYYVDETALQIQEQNIFTAMEIRTLLPVAGQVTLEQFFSINNWADDYLPACLPRQQDKGDDRKHYLKQCTEWMLKNRLGNFLESYLFRLTQKRWNKKLLSEKRNNKGFRMNLLTSRHFAKSNPENFQEKVLMVYRQKLASVMDEGYMLSSAR